MVGMQARVHSHLVGPLQVVPPHMPHAVGLGPVQLALQHLHAGMCMKMWRIQPRSTTQMRSLGCMLLPHSLPVDENAVPKNHQGSCVHHACQPASPCVQPTLSVPHFLSTYAHYHPVSWPPAGALCPPHGSGWCSLAEAHRRATCSVHADSPGTPRLLHEHRSWVGQEIRAAPDCTMSAASGQ